MTTLKTLHDTETGEPKRIKYSGNNTDISFTLTPGGVAKIQDIRTTDIEDNAAWVDLQEVRHAMMVVGDIRYVNDVRAVPTENNNESE